MIQAAPTQPAPHTTRPQHSAPESQRFSQQIRSEKRPLGQEQRLHREIVNSLKASDHFQLWKVAVRVEGDHVSLNGQVSSYYLKQLAQTFVLKLAGVKRLDNELVVA